MRYAFAIIFLDNLIAFTRSSRSGPYIRVAHMKSAYYGPDSMFTSANLAAARLSALENQQCLKAKAAAGQEDSVHGNTLGKAHHGRKTLGSSLVSVAALISKLDEEQPRQWESGSAPTLQLRPVRKPDEALRIFLQRVEKARTDREVREDENVDTVPVQEADSSNSHNSFDPYSSQTITLDRVPAYEREIRRTAYSLLMKSCGPERDFVTASDNRFNASTTILVARAEAILLSERLLRRVEHGFSVTTPAWTLSTPDTNNTPALFESCRTPQNVKVTVQNCQNFDKEQQLLKDKRMQQLIEEVSQEIIQETKNKSRKAETSGLERFITGILESAERLPRLNVADVPVNAMSAATTIL